MAAFSLQGLAQALSERATGGLMAGKRLLDDGGPSAEALVLAKRTLSEISAAEKAAEDALSHVAELCELAAKRLSSVAEFGDLDEDLIGLDRACAERANQWRQAEDLIDNSCPLPPLPTMTAAERDAWAILQTRDIRAKWGFGPGSSSTGSPEKETGSHAAREECPAAPGGLGNLLFRPGSACTMLCRADSCDTEGLSVDDPEDAETATEEPLMNGVPLADDDSQYAETIFCLLDLDQNDLLDADELRNLNNRIGLILYNSRVRKGQADVDRDILSNRLNPDGEAISSSVFCDRLLGFLEEIEDCASARRVQLQRFLREAQAAKAEAMLQKSVARAAEAKERAAGRSLDSSPSAALQKGPLGAPQKPPRELRTEAPKGLLPVLERVNSTDTEATDAARSAAPNLRSAVWPLDEDTQLDRSHSIGSGASDSSGAYPASVSNGKKSPRELLRK
eukprot:TRINITY_DN30113_c0_g1_i2.p1 TRINITY_DN30113_c0_g1~~TRINITY_DN30113_c0_g1_i2.p1  ORF type:complete len:451 (-),score=90.69 TRINITY_DN30113_c0_g1_i2:17-1369(-)